MKDFTKIFWNNGFISGRMISGSKTAYRNNHPDHEVIFNANIITDPEGKIWHGDIDYTLDKDNLKEIAKQLDRDLYILYEMDARFENENKSIEFYKSKAKFIIKKD